jgi:hypothetical protein
MDAGLVGLSDRYPDKLRLCQASSRTFAHFLIALMMEVVSTFET